MASKNFRINLGATINQQSLEAEILKYNGKYSLTVGLNIDTSSIASKLKSVSETINKQLSGAGTSGKKGDGPSSILIPNDDSINTITTSYDDMGNAIGATVSKVQDLKNSSKEFYSINEDGNSELIRTITTENKGRKENLMLVEKNIQQVDKLRGNIKAYGSQSKLSKREVKEFSKELETVFAMTNEKDKSKALTKLNTDIRTAAESTGILGQSFTKAMTKYVTWLGIATIVAQLSHAIKSVINQVHILDDALVELKKVSDLSSEGLEKIKSRAFALGNQLATTGSQVLAATTEFARAGYTIDESFKLAEVALTLTNVAENINDAGEAATYLISILKGANMPISKAAELLDQLNEVSNNFAVDLGSLADMVQRITGTMTTYGNSIQETMALVTGAYEVLQDERVARGVSTIAARIAGLNEDLEAEEGLANDVSNALMKYAKVDVFDVGGQLRDTYDILEELSQKWDYLSKNAQSVLLNIVAGKNRMDVLSSILTNWEGVANSLEATTKAEGSAAEEQGAYLDSITGRLNTLSNAWQSFADNSLDSDFVKGIVSLTTSLVTLADTLGGLPTILTAIVGLVGTLKLSALFEQISNGTKVLGKFKLALAGIGGVLSAITIGISLVTSVVSAINSAKEAAEQALAERIAELKEDTIAIKELNDSYFDVISQTSSVDEQNEKLKKGYEDLITLAKKYSIALKDVNGEQKDFVDLAEETNAEILKRQQRENLGDYEKAKQTISVLESGIRSRQRMGGEPSESVLGKIEEAQKVVTQYEVNEATLSFYKNEKDMLRALRSSYAEWAQGTTKEMAQQSSDMLSQIDKFVSDITSKYPVLESYINDIVGDMKTAVEAAKNTDLLTLALEDRLSALKQQKALEEKELKTQKELLKVEEKRAALAEARNKKTRVFRAGVGYVYESDLSAVNTAQSEYQDALVSAGQTGVDKEISNIEALMDAYNIALAEEADKGSTEIRDFFLDATSYAEFFALSFSEQMKMLSENIKTYDAGEITASSPLIGSLRAPSTLLKDSQGDSPSNITIGNISLDNVTNVDEFIQELKTISNFPKYR